MAALMGEKHSPQVSAPWCLSLPFLSEINLLLGTLGVGLVLLSLSCEYSGIPGFTVPFLPLA